MASRALTHKFSKTVSSWLLSDRMAGKLRPCTTFNLIRSPSDWRKGTDRSDNVSVILRSSIRNVCLREKARSFFTKAAARFTVVLISCNSRYDGSPTGWRPKSSSVFRRMVVRRLLKSWATPAASCQGLRRYKH